MKNIKLLSIIILQLFFFQSAVGQTLDNGRADDAMPAAVKQETGKTIPTDPVSNANGYFSDFDVPGNPPADQTDWVYPTDLNNQLDELNASAGPQEVAERINALEARMQELVQYNEQLRLENQAIKKSLNNCCSANAAGLEVSDAYILQNAPNPFTSSSQISYFIPTEVQEEARIDVTSVNGELIHSFQIDQNGFGTINLKSDILQTGTYIYTLHIGGEIIDSKIMMITQ